jgi:hypothetical protein
MAHLSLEPYLRAARQRSDRPHFSRRRDDVGVGVGVGVGK